MSEALLSKQSIRTKQWIYQALKIMMTRKPYNKITITDIVNKAGVTRPTFYRYFIDKDDIFRQYFQKSFHEVMVSIRSHKSWHERIDIIAEGTFSVISRESDFIHLMMKSGCHHIFLSIAEENIDELYKDITHKDLQIYKYYMRMNLGGVYMVMLEWIRSGKKHTPKQMSVIMSNILMPISELENEDLIRQVYKELNQESSRIH
ncbi:TetR/AcrR family transcriptional regulator [Acidaminobacter sp. JC074]|uniref:TetR/AcrR family transcriptional regulator n=1 Tax=Acidaminobacter sp. JC074 TaxID=2530199 RepID=UPI001F0CEC01|nr:TetR/AcrR family transcriptional regulator [Acidaminobacter sp. JC074]MCH4886459.1 TetR/AcrR family transcriptional regulator [Acidaminobacter sp. JC074]